MLSKMTKTSCRLVNARYTLFKQCPEELPMEEGIISSSVGILSSAALLTARQIVESVHLRLKGHARVDFGAHCRANLYNVQTSLNVSTKTEKIGKLFILYQRLSRRMEDKAPRRCTFNCRLQGYSLHLCQAQRSVENHHMKFRTCCLNLSRKKCSADQRRFPI